MSERRKLDVLAIGVNAKSGYTPAKGDLVGLSDGWEVEALSSAHNYPIGTVVVTDNKRSSKIVTVETKYRRQATLTASEAITAPSYLVAAGSGKYANADILTTPTHLWNQVVGVALEDAAADGSTFEALLF